MNAELPVEPPLPRLGDVVGGKYRLERGIGGGGMGLVYEAIHVRLSQRVAIKFMQPKLVGHPDSVARFEREGRAASSLASPHAARIFDVDVTSEGIPYIVSEFLVGRDLRAELEQRRRLPVEEALRYGIQICAVMAEAHANGIVHRDLKPSNLFLAETKTGRVMKVVDFGISKVSSEEELDLTTTGVMLGSPRYMSPEQAQAKPADRRADIWSLGVVLFRALSDAYPFEGDTPLAMAVATLSEKPRDLAALVPEIPPALAGAIVKALERDVSRRYDTMRDFADALAPFASPDMAALAASLTRDVAVPSPRSSQRDLARASGVNTRASVVDTEASSAPNFDEYALPIDVEPTEHITRPSVSGVRATNAELPPSARSRSRWKIVVTAAAVSVLAVGAAYAVTRSKPPSADASRTTIESKGALDEPSKEEPAAAAIAIAPTSVAATTGSATASATRPGRSPSGPAANDPRRAAPPPPPPATTPHKNPNYL